MSLLEVRQVSHAYRKSSLLGAVRRGAPVLQEVSLSLREGECLGLLGTSGAGKSTLGRVILGLERPQSGQVLFQGVDVYEAKPAERRRIRRDLQVVFQDCYSSVNPRMTAGQIIGEPLQNFERLTPGEQELRVCTLLERVGLQTADRLKAPHEFSGGQLQRINIARAIALNPKLIVLDEAVSALDRVTQSHILRLLEELKRDLGLAYLFITHDLKAAFAISDSLAVMERGALVERCGDRQDFMSSSHPSVRMLVDSMLSEHPGDRRGRRASSG